MTELPFIHPQQRTIYHELESLMIRDALAITEQEIADEYAQAEADYDRWVTQAEYEAEQDYLATCGAVWLQDQDEIIDSTEVG